MADSRPLSDYTSVRPILSRISFLGGITDEQLDTLLGYFEQASCPAGTVIAREGEEPSHIYIIQKGRVSLRISDEEHTVTKREFAVGDSFGEAAMLSMVNNTASFVASEDCNLIVFSRKSLARLHLEDRDLFCQLILNMARELARKLQYTDELMLRMK